MVFRAVIGLVAFLSGLVQAQVISPLGQEIEISYTASFLAYDESEDPLIEASSHSDYLLGVLKSENFVESLGVSFMDSEGIGAPRLPLRITHVKTRALDNGRTEISYAYRAKALIHKTAAKSALRQGGFKVVLPYDSELVYDERCTDAHYTSFDDYWYFWDPYRLGCEALLEEPATREVQIRVKALNYRRLEETARFDLIHADNGNGNLLQIDLISGFDESGARGDIGWKIFHNLNRALESSKFGFELIKKSGTAKRPLYLFEKNLDSGVRVLVRHLLVDTAIDSRSAAFAKFFRDSVRDADVIIYSGHSGLGGNLDLPSLEGKAGAFEFNPLKRQLFFFNSCSSYSYFLDHFRQEKTKARIDVLTNALAAYMDEDSLEVQALLENVLDEKQRAPLWMDVLKKMEAAIPYDMTYLLSVGGV